MRKWIIVTFIALLCLVPAAADAKLVVSKSPTVACGASLKLGVSARHHHGSRRVKVRIYNGKRLMYKRTIRAPKRFSKRLACGKRYRIVYRLPSGRKVVRRTRVLEQSGSFDTTSALPVTNGGSRNPSSDKPTPAEQQQEDAEDAYMDALEACDKINEAHENDENWDDFACWPADPDDESDPSEDDGDDE